ncbi:HipA domain-containing protein [Candidatus Omnitrophus magneticus]|uniref:HipA domain-containing protein n=1 Tax=Candidatus Omnitrophus magneticus TaxID=1609969 RepID=A0A0F0CR47_9BACT|nr:HipA domain-containing protein [Candidatus Omnitrophus magneticus]
MKNKKIAWRRVFDIDREPFIDLTLAGVSLKAQEMVGKMSISGVQPKFSVRIVDKKNEPRLEVTGEGGQYILKPQVQAFVNLPENEELCMTMAEDLGIHVPAHCLVHLKDKSLAYVVKRFDRKGLHKIHQEDFAQILGKRDKYDGSIEEIGRKLKAVSEVPGLDVQLFFERVVFNFLIGNGDAHMKNYSVIYNEEGLVRLAPLYDLVCSRIVIPEESEESALTIHGKKSRIKRKDMDSLAEYLGIPEKVRFAKFAGQKNIFRSRIAKSLLPKSLAKNFDKLFIERFQRLELT